MVRNRCSLLLITLLFLTVQCVFTNFSYASTYEAVYIHQYTNDAGQKVSIREMVNNDKATLVLLWANWCEPCKKELKWLAPKLRNNSDLNVVTINVDDASDQAGAKQFLQSIDTPWPSLFDVDGEQFYNYHQSGQLPVVLFFQKGGRLANRFGHFTEPELKQVLAATQKAPAFTSEKLGFSLTNRLRYREQEVAGKSTQKVIAERFNTTFAGDWYDISFNYDQLHQTKDNGDFQSYEDEFGFSYAEFRFPTSEGHTPTVRIGGKNMMVANGLNFAARTNRDTNENLFVSGGFAQYKTTSFSLELFAGRLRNNLFPAIINPATDLSKTLPVERVSGVEISLAQFGMEWLKFTPSLAYTNLERDKFENLGFLENYKDTRSSVGNEFVTPYFTANGTWTTYKSDNSVHEEGASALVNVSLIPLTIGSTKTNISFSGLRLNIPQDDIYQHTSVPVLVDDLATPLLKQKREEAQARFRFIADDWAGLFFEPLYAEQKTINSDPVDSLYNAAAKLGFTEWNLKWQFSQVRTNEKSTDQRLEEQIYTFSFPIYGILTGWMENRQIDVTNITSGITLSEGLREAQGLSLHWSPFKDHTLQCDFVHYYVNGYYLAQSGFDRRSFEVYKAKYAAGIGFIEWIEGKEPGGYVCTAGNCQFLEPRDGREINTGINLTF